MPSTATTISSSMPLGNMISHSHPASILPMLNTRIAKTIPSTTAKNWSHSKKRLLKNAIHVNVRLRMGTNYFKSDNDDTIGNIIDDSTKDTSTTQLIMCRYSSKNNTTIQPLTRPLGACLILLYSQQQTKLGLGPQPFSFLSWRLYSNIITKIKVAMWMEIQMPVITLSQE